MGALFAWTGRLQLQFEPGLAGSRVFKRLIRFLAVVWTPCSAFFLWAYPSWSWWYLLPDGEVGLEWRLFPLGIEWLAAIGAFVLTRESIRNGRRQIAVGWMAAIGGLNVWMSAANLERWSAIGTYMEFKAGLAMPLSQPGPFWVQMALISLFFGGAAAWVVYANERDNRNPKFLNSSPA